LAAVVFTQIGDTLGTISVLREKLSNSSSTSDNNSSTDDSIKSETLKDEKDKNDS
ncbi:MAG: DUF6774 domain-containing protein, partial [Coprobacillaceae bacterium]